MLCSPAVRHAGAFVKRSETTRRPPATYWDASAIIKHALKVDNVPDPTLGNINRVGPILAWPIYGAKSTYASRRYSIRNIVGPSRHQTKKTQEQNASYVVAQDVERLETSPIEIVVNDGSVLEHENE
ncbi:hypothetical protein EVAR_12506_1 [Eumeta japonica]|uniref:Uncharacterized protein n=1 Tax=Eumeta variegata TaxID=151549 RepID=A0A4C1TPL4_EUMVA|nr:hypothetical protein EVAR_12506_1 [Eumeta japonica]